jgi:TonB family protein
MDYMTNLRLHHCFVCAALFLSSLSSRMWAQTDRLQDKLNSAYTGKTVLVRNFYSGRVLEYGLNGQLLSPSRRGPWTLAGMEITRIAVRSVRIEINGNRMGVVFKNGKMRFIKVGKLQILVDTDVSESRSNAVFNLLSQRIFIDPRADLRLLLPDFWQAYFSGSDLKSRTTAWRTALERDTAASLPANVSPRTGAVSAPRAIRSPDPKYTKEARSQRIEGPSRLVMVINTSGRAENIAITGPLGMGLDEEAVNAVREWEFRPAMKGGQPVRVQINIEVDFRCCP